jgi:hypothetical protein
MDSFTTASTRSPPASTGSRSARKHVRPSQLTTIGRRPSSTLPPTRSASLAIH